MIISCSKKEELPKLGGKHFVDYLSLYLPKMGLIFHHPPSTQIFVVYIPVVIHLCSPVVGVKSNLYEALSLVNL